MRFATSLLCVALWVMVSVVGNCAAEAIDSSASQRLSEKGWAAFRMQEYRSALTSFEEALKAAAPKSPEHLFAVYSVGVVSQLQRPNPAPERARATYEGIVAENPGNELAAWSLLRLARMDHIVGAGETPNYKRVGLAYTRVIEAFPNHPAAQEAFLHLQASKLVAMEVGGAAEAEKGLLDFLEKHPDSPYVTAVYALLTDCYRILGDHPKWVAAEIKALASSAAMKGNTHANFAPAYWRIATLAQYRVGDLQTAEKYYKRLIAEYPRDQRAYPAELGLAEIERLRETGAP